MRKVFIFSICLVALLSLSTVTNAELYEMDAATAILMRPIAVSSGSVYSLNYIGAYPGDSIDKVAGSSPTYGDTMTYAVGFAGNLEDQTASPYEAILTIGIGSSDISAMISGSYDGFLLPISNDDNQAWSYRAYVDDGTNPVIYSDWQTVNPDPNPIGGRTANLLVQTPTLNYSTLAGIGFQIMWSDAGSSSDNFHTSVVPVPGAVLLGLLGIGASGLKLRKFA